MYVGNLAHSTTKESLESGARCGFSGQEPPPAWRDSVVFKQVVDGGVVQTVVIGCSWMR